MILGGYAVCSGHSDVLTLLFKKGIEAGSEDETRMELLVSAVEKGHEAVVKLLLETGKIDLGSKDGNGTGMALLVSAVEKGHEAVVKLLLETSKVDLESKDGNGRTPLSYAVEGV
jgi:ankyrin repeat protein